MNTLSPPYIICTSLACTLYKPFQVVEAFEVMILSILSATLKCEWNLSYTEEALITTVIVTFFTMNNLSMCFILQVVFLGLLIGAPFWGFVADKYGRKKVYILLV